MSSQEHKIILTMTENDKLSLKLVTHIENVWKK